MHRRGEERRLGFKVHFSYQITSEIANAHHHNSFTMLQVLEAAAREEIAKINSESNEEDNGGGHAKNDDDDDDDDDEDDDGSRGVASAATLKAEAEVLEKEAKVRERRSFCNTISEQDQLHLRFCSVFILALPSPFSSSTLSCSPISLPFFFVSTYFCSILLPILLNATRFSLLSFNTSYFNTTTLGSGQGRGEPFGESAAVLVHCGPARAFAQLAPGEEREREGEREGEEEEHMWRK